jgi:hypothetical protein
MDEILQSDLPDVDKLKAAFGSLSDAFLRNAEKKLEMAQAMRDEDAVIKEQIKMEMMKLARGMLQNCYLRVTQLRSHAAAQPRRPGDSR